MTPYRLPTPSQIADDPERAVLAALDITLELAENALIAACPELCDDHFPDGAGEVALCADRLLVLAREVHGALARYQLAQLRARQPGARQETEEEAPPF